MPDAETIHCLAYMRFNTLLLVKWVTIGLARKKRGGVLPECLWPEHSFRPLTMVPRNSEQNRSERLGVNVEQFFCRWE